MRERIANRLHALADKIDPDWSWMAVSADGTLTAYGETRNSSYGLSAGAFACYFPDDDDSFFDWLGDDPYPAGLFKWENGRLVEDW